MVIVGKAAVTEAVGCAGSAAPARRTGYPLTVASIEELEARVAALEDQVVLIRQDAAAARVLAGRR